MLISALCCVLVCWMVLSITCHHCRFIDVDKTKLGRYTSIAKKSTLIYRYWTEVIRHVLSLQGYPVFDTFLPIGGSNDWVLLNQGLFCNFVGCLYLVVGFLSSWMT